MPERLTDPRLNTLALFLDCSEALVTEASEIYKRHGLRHREATVIFRLIQAPDLRLQMKEVARFTGTSTSGVTTVVDNLESRGLVTRRLADNDRRSWWIVLTDRGQEVIGAIIEQLLPALDESFFQPLGEDLGRFTELLSRVAERLPTKGGSRPGYRNLP